MRIALVQCVVRPGTRSANITRLTRLIDQACEGDPAPDLVLLPARCEPRMPGTNGGGISRAMGDALAGTLAMKAREWGVFLAGGHRTCDDAGPVVQGLLFDPDGDVIIRVTIEDAAQGEAVCVRTTPLGAVGLLLGGCAGDEAPPDLLEPCALLVVAGFTEEGTSVESGVGEPARLLRRLARQHRCHVCGAFPLLPRASSPDAPRSSAGPSRVYAPDGSQIARAPNREAVVAVELAIGSPRGSGLPKGHDRTDGAGTSERRAVEGPAERQR